MANCRECKETIKDGASRCPHCTAQQSVFRYLVKGPVVATFVLTIVSIVSTPLWLETFGKKSAEINVAIMDGDSLHTTFMISNNGNRAAGLTSVKIAANRATYYLKTPLDMQLIEPSKAYVLKAENSDLIPAHISYEVQEMFQKQSFALDHNCRLQIEYVQMKGHKEILRYPFPCQVPRRDSAPFSN